MLSARPRPTRLLPRVIGALLALDAAGYLADGVTALLAPGVAAHPSLWTELATVAGEGSLCLWLLLGRVGTRRWRERAGA